MEIVLASRNNKKIAELQALLSEYLPDIKVLSLDDIGFEGDIIEDGESFEENAMIKAASVAERGYIGVGDDSGLTVNALGGAPGIYSARYARTSLSFEFVPISAPIFFKIKSAACTHSCII